MTHFIVACAIAIVPFYKNNNRTVESFKTHVKYSALTHEFDYVQTIIIISERTGQRIVWLPESQCSISVTSDK